jgi:hypothetical protein
MPIAKVEDFHPAVQLLLARMKTDPEEFADPDYRWQKVFAETCKLANPAERFALEETLRVIRLDAVHVMIMKIMTCADEPDDVLNEARLEEMLAQQRRAAVQAQQMKAFEANAQQIARKEIERIKGNLGGAIGGLQESYKDMLSNLGNNWMAPEYVSVYFDEPHKPDLKELWRQFATRFNHLREKTP